MLFLKAGEPWLALPLLSWPFGAGVLLAWEVRVNCFLVISSMSSLSPSSSEEFSPQESSPVNEMIIFGGLTRAFAFRASYLPCPP